MNKTASLDKTRTFWLGVSALFVTTIQHVFGDSETAQPVGTILSNLLTDPKLFVGVLALTGRKAILTLQNGG
ncbi:MAG: hypothetical protein WBC05_13400 [Sedimentisphaerales bacterium]